MRDLASSSGRVGPVATAILGGTFDPVHKGHLLVAREVADQLGYGRVVFVPAWISPHKSEAPAASPQARLEMLRIAIAGDRRFEVDPIEIERGGTSYSVDTVRYFAAAGDVAGRPGLIIGEDLVATFETWREVDEIERIADIILVRRPGYAGETLGRRHRVVENEQIDASATGVRQRLAAGLPCDDKLPPGVARYIEENGLYR